MLANARLHLILALVLVRVQTQVLHQLNLTARRPTVTEHAKLALTDLFLRMENALL